MLAYIEQLGTFVPVEVRSLLQEIPSNMPLHAQILPIPA